MLLIPKNTCYISGNNLKKEVRIESGSRYRMDKRYLRVSLFLFLLFPYCIQTMIRGGIVMSKKLRKLTKLNLLVSICVCASTFLGAAFVYSIWNWLVPEFLQLPSISFANCVSVITALARPLYIRSSDCITR